MTAGSFLFLPAPADEGDCPPPARRRGWFSEDGSSECLSISPLGWLASGGPTFGRPKVGGKTAGETPDPLFFV